MRGRRQRSGECDAAGRGQAHRERSPREWGPSGGASNVPARGLWAPSASGQLGTQDGGDPHRVVRRSGESLSPSGSGAQEVEEEPPTWNAPRPRRGRSRSVRWVASPGFARMGSSQTPSQPGTFGYAWAAAGGRTYATKNAGPAGPLIGRGWEIGGARLAALDRSALEERTPAEHAAGRTRGRGDWPRRYLAYAAHCGEQRNGPTTR